MQKILESQTDLAQPLFGNRKIKQDLVVCGGERVEPRHDHQYKCSGSKVPNASVLQEVNHGEPELETIALQKPFDLATVVEYRNPVLPRNDGQIS